MSNCSFHYIDAGVPFPRTVGERDGGTLLCHIHLSHQVYHVLLVQFSVPKNVSAIFSWRARSRYNIILSSKVSLDRNFSVLQESLPSIETDVLYELCPIGQHDAIHDAIRLLFLFRSVLHHICFRSHMQGPIPIQTRFPPFRAPWLIL